MIVTKPTQEKTMKTVYCLYRVSTKGQVDKNDIPMQKQSCREFAEHQPGWVIKKEFQEKVFQALRFRQMTEMPFRS
nr:recombinase family protein [uncultured Ruminococcus sp.]